MLPVPVQGHFTLGLLGKGSPGATTIMIVGSRGSISIDTSTSSMTAHADGKVAMMLQHQCASVCDLDRH